MSLQSGTELIGQVKDLSSDLENYMLRKVREGKII